MSGRWLLLFLLLLPLVGCPEPTFTQEQLLDPATCESCHPAHYREWSGSMHAYAVEDPVFQALVARAERETEGGIGTFCLDCHAPTAVAAGYTSIEDIPEELAGVTCASCHLAEDITRDHNNGLVLASDLTMRGGIDDPRPNRAHASMYSSLHDRNDLESSDMCGSCHDVVLPTGFRLERTWEEWTESLFAEPGPARQSCGHCHMPGRNDVAANNLGVPTRRVHDHRMPGIDIAVTDFPEREDQRIAVQQLLDRSLLAGICVVPTAGGVDIQVTIENVGAGHAFPSGAAHDRRVWVELTAWRGDEEALVSGRVAPGQPLAELEAEDPLLWAMYERTWDAEGNPKPMMWNVTEGDSSSLLPTSVTADPTDPRFYHARTRAYPLLGTPPDAIEMAVHVRPFPLDLLQDLVDSGDLDPAVIDAQPTFTLAPTRLRWEGQPGDCVGNVGP